VTSTTASRYLQPRISGLAECLPSGDFGGVLGSWCASDAYPVGCRADVEAEQMTEYDGWHIAGEVHQGGVAGWPDPHAERVESMCKLLGAERLAGDRAGEQPGLRAVGVLVATLVGELRNKVVHRLRQRHGLGPQGECDAVLAGLHVLGGETDDPAAGLGEQQ